QSSMKRHPSLPDLQNIEGCLQVSAQIIKEDVSDTAAHHDADDDVEQQIIEIIGRELQSSLLREAFQEEVADDERHHVHQAVPPQLNGAEPQEYRIDMRKLHLQHHGKTSAVNR